MFQRQKKVVLDRHEARKRHGPISYRTQANKQSKIMGTNSCLCSVSQETVKGGAGVDELFFMPKESSKLSKSISLLFIVFRTHHSLMSSEIPPTFNSQLQVPFSFQYKSSSFSRLPQLLTYTTLHNKVQVSLHWQRGGGFLPGGREGANALTLSLPAALLLQLSA